VKEMLKIQNPLAHRRLKGTLDKALQHCDDYLQMFPTLKTGAGAGKTDLDKHRMEECCKFIVSFIMFSNLAYSLKNNVVSRCQRYIMLIDSVVYV